MGPVFVALPMDVLDDVTTEPAMPTSVPVTQVTPDAAQIEHAARLLAHAQRPLIIFGDGVAFSGRQRELVAVAEALGADVWGRLVGDQHPDVSPSVPRPARPHVRKPQRSDRRRGRRDPGGGDVPPARGVSESREHFAATPAVVHVDLDAYEIAKNFPVDLGLAPTLPPPSGSDPGSADAMTPEDTLGQRPGGRRRARAAMTRTARAKAADVASWDQTPMRPARFMSELAKRLGPQEA